MTSSISSVTGTESATAGPGSVPLVQGPKQLGQEDFLQLLVTQLRNQDPLKPVSNEAFIAELAQFSQLEQSTKLVRLMEQSLDPKVGGRQFNIVSLIGRQVKLAGDLVELGNGPAAVGYELAGDAGSVQIDILDSQGLVVRSLHYGSQGAGPQSVQWDGLDANGTPMPAGIYRAVVAARDDRGNPVVATLSARLTVSGIRMVDGEPNLLVGSRMVDADQVREVY